MRMNIGGVVMFQVEVNKSMSQNIICIKFLQSEIENDFRCEMLKQNKIRGILAVHRVFENAQVLYSFNITGKVSLLKRYSHDELDYAQTKEILSQIFLVIRDSKEYLLEEDSFLLDAQYIFTRREQVEIELCYCPGYHMDIRLQLVTMMEFFMNKIDYKEAEAVRLVYQVYQMVREESSSVYQILNVLTQQKVINPPPIHVGAYEQPVQTKEAPVSESEGTRKEIKTKEGHAKVLDVKEKQRKMRLQTAGMILAALLGGAAIMLALYYNGFFYKTMGLQLDYIKVTVSLVMILVCEAYLIWKITSECKIRESSSEQTIEEKEVKGKIPPSIVTEPPVRPEWNPMFTEIELAPPTPKKGYHLVPKNVSHPVKEIPNNAHTFVGKERMQVDIILPSEAVSRVHAEFVEEEGTLYVQDLGSTNGTYLNAKRLSGYQKTEVHEGDELRIADLVYLVSA